MTVTAVPPAGRNHPDRHDVASLALRAADGDDVAFAGLCRHLDKILRHYASRFYGPGLDHDDLLQEARIALHAACLAWDAHTVPFVPFAQLVIDRHLIDILKATQRLRHRPLNDSHRLEATVAPQDGSESTLADILPGPWHENPAHIAEAREDLATVIRVFHGELTSLQQIVVARRFNGATLDQAGQGLGRSTRGPRKTADNAIQRARHRIAEALAA